MMAVTKRIPNLLAQQELLPCEVILELEEKL